VITILSFGVAARLCPSAGGFKLSNFLRRKFISGKRRNLPLIKSAGTSGKILLDQWYMTPWTTDKILLDHW
jgi:hypothetical protein